VAGRFDFGLTGGGASGALQEEGEGLFGGQGVQADRRLDIESGEVVGAGGEEEAAGRGSWQKVGQPFRVIGVVEDEEVAGRGGQPLDDGADDDALVRLVAFG
jgi:hypothetical protein